MEQPDVKEHLEAEGRKTPPPVLDIPDDLPQSNSSYESQAALLYAQQAMLFPPPPPPPPPYRPRPNPPQPIQAPTQTKGYIRKRQVDNTPATPNLEKLAFFGDVPAEPSSSSSKSKNPSHLDKKPRQETVEQVREKLLQRLSRAGHTAPSVKEALRPPVIISNKIGRGITPEQAERAKAEGIAKMLRWKYDRIVKTRTPDAPKK